MTNPVKNERPSWKDWPEVREAAAVGVDMSERSARLVHLPFARGRFCDSTGRVNAHGKIDGARFLAYDTANKMVLLRLDHSALPEFWAEVWFPMAQLSAFIEDQTMAEVNEDLMEDDDDDDNDSAEDM